MFPPGTTQLGKENMQDDDWEPGDDIQTDFITVFAGALAQPLADLISAFSLQQIRSVRDHVGEKENGYCISILVLTVLTFESFLGRAAHLRRVSTGEGRQKSERHTLDLIRNMDAKFPEHLMESLHEIYALRDAVAHAHVWTVAYTIQKNGTTITGRELHPGYGEARHRKVVDNNTGRTRVLQLNALPTEIGLDEAIAAFRTLRAAVQRLVDVGVIERPAVTRTIKHDGRHVAFWSLVDELERLRNLKPIRQPKDQAE